MAADAPPLLRRPALRVPLRALSGGSLTVDSSSAGRVSSTRPKKYSRTSGYRWTLACQSSSMPRLRAASASRMSRWCGRDL